MATQGKNWDSHLQQEDRLSARSCSESLKDCIEHVVFPLFFLAPK
jgi:hypothetical protein